MRIYRPLLHGLILSATFLLSAPNNSWAQNARSTLKEAEQEKKRIKALIADLSDDIDTIESDLQTVEEQVQSLETQLNLKQQELAQLEGRLDAEKAEIAERISALYRLTRRGTNRLIFGSEDPVDLRRRNAYLMTLIEAEVERFESFHAKMESTRKELSAAESAVMETKASLEQRKENLTEERRRLEVQMSQRESALAYSNTQYNDAKAELDASAREAAALRVEQERDSIRGAGSTAAEASYSRQSFRSSYGRLRWPVAGKVIHRYGKYQDDNGQTVDSKGLDIAADYGQPVRVVFDGEVQLTDYVRGYGQTVVVKHGSYATVYAHLNGIRVRKGQQLKAGDVVGLVGNTGLSDNKTYMLTFEIRYKNHAQDPSPWLAPE